MSVILRPISADDASDTFELSNCATEIDALAREVTAPTLPADDVYIYPYALDNTLIIEFQEQDFSKTIKSAHIKTCLKVYNLSEFEDVYFIHINEEIEVYNPSGYDTTQKWYDVDITESAKKVVQGGTNYLEMYIADYNIPSLVIYDIYLEVEYEEEGNAPALKKRPPQMSGYNYFIKNYLNRLKANEKPYKLPTGELYP